MLPGHMLLSKLPKNLYFEIGQYQVSNICDTADIEFVGVLVVIELSLFKLELYFCIYVCLSKD